MILLRDDSDPAGVFVLACSVFLITGHQVGRVQILKSPNCDLSPSVNESGSLAALLDACERQEGARLGEAQSATRLTTVLQLPVGRDQSKT